MKRILLDVDGVLANWCKGMSDWFGGDFDQDDVKTWEWAKEHLELSDEAYNEGVRNSEFWERLPRTDEFFQILDLLEPYKKSTCLLTAPSCAGGLDGKQTWIKNHLPEFFDAGNYLIGPAKHFAAGGNALLIDDSQVNCIKFKAGGGSAILVPRRWNANWGKDVIETIDEGLQRYVNML